MIETIYVIRHAFRSNFVVNPQTGEYTASPRTPTGPTTAPPPRAHGVAQSKELANHLCSIDPPIDRIYSSPFYRCLQTLLPTSSKLFAEGRAEGKIRIDRGLGEFYGRADFAHPTPPDLTVLAPFFADLDHEYVSKYVPHEKGELILELHDRVAKAIRRIVQDTDAEKDGPKTILICSHAATMIVLGRALTGKMPEDPDDDDFQCYTASLSTFKRKTDKPEVLGNWACVGNAETHFLSGGAERGWKFNGDESFISFPEALAREQGQAPKL